MQEVNVQGAKLYTLQLPSVTESITELENLVEKLADQLQVGDDTFANMMTCLNEAVMNAIIHGNDFDPNKKVFVNVEIDGRTLIWTVSDEGDGFDYSHLPDPTDTSNIEKLTGRGVFIIKHLADQCIFNTKGNEVELHFKI
ncbi:ATP-binding protein [Mucilaginibacter ginkgonis]|uniref:ATP-binding protein n=1 Tax=Mucilaginibacter ginkgonis TaxID=2682091 RepID=A0A6I4HXI1_9SPHI|nr:ATP-binding protein [Mucilaginibacter ginkgonis]QQL49372.1 ATP-binding protein [Mucilaginibacter ginkgonis]